MPLPSTALNTGSTAMRDRVSRPGLAALLLASSAFAGPALAQTAPIVIQAAIPAAPPAVQIFRLSTATAPTDFLNAKLQALGLPALRIEQDRLTARGSQIKDHADLVRAYVNRATNDAELIPDLAELVKTTSQPLPPDKLETIGDKALASLIPKDQTVARPTSAIPVMGGPLTKVTTTAVAAPRTIMTLVPAVRYAAGWPVFGRGSHAMVTLANDGTVVGMTRHWKSAASFESLKTRISTEQVSASILRQLKGITSTGSHAVVDQVRLAYYDGGANYLQPVYEFEAMVTPAPAVTGAPSPISPIRVNGFVPIVQTLEPIPDLATPPAKGTGPATPKQAITLNGAGTPDAATDASLRAEIGGAGTADDFTLGEYANQDWQNDSGYVDMANTFLGGLLSDNIAPINRTQWYVAYPWEVVGANSRYYMNAVNVAYTVPHGDWLVNSTLRNCCQPWSVTSIGTGGAPGFGAAAGGVLATWIIMSCEVIPSYYDRLNEINGSGNGFTAFNAWWPVFQGLHNAIGFRTIMYYPDDNLQSTFGQDAALGGDVNATWFQSLAAVEGGVGTYASQHLNGHPQVHYDRGSAMVDSRDLGQSIYAIQAQTASSGLWNFWMGN
jgi:hypothetical protein